MRIRRASEGDIPGVISLLKDASLPVDGILRHRDHLYVLETRGTVAGAVGYEAYPPSCLLRSLVVAPSARGHGCGRQLISFILEQAQRDGMRDAYGLTTTIAERLLRLGFEEISRSRVPVEVLDSEEFRGACPRHARLFHLRLATPGRKRGVQEETR